MSGEISESRTLCSAPAKITRITIVGLDAYVEIDSRLMMLSGTCSYKVSWAFYMLRNATFLVLLGD